jgi:hypothetical protein
VRLLEHAQEQHFPFTERLALFPDVLFARHSRLLPALCGLQLPAQQVTLQTQQVTLLLQDQHRLCFYGSLGLLRSTGAWCCILERWSVRLLRAPLERVAGTQQFRSINVPIWISTQAAGMDGTVERGARDTRYTCCITDTEPGHTSAFPRWGYCLTLWGQGARG